MRESALYPSDSFALCTGIRESNDLAILHDRREQVLADFKDERVGGEAEACQRAEDHHSPQRNLQPLE